MYEQLVKVCPGVEEYKVYLAQSLYKAGAYAEATRAAVRVDGEQYAQRLLMLQSAVKYEQDELTACKALLDQCLDPEDPDVVVNYAATAFKEGKFAEARAQYTDAMNTAGYQPELAYNIALCHYRENAHAAALKGVAEVSHLVKLARSLQMRTVWVPTSVTRCPLSTRTTAAADAQVIERGVREHPELGVGSSTDGADMRSVGNSAVLAETYLVEAFNLKAAIEFTMKNPEAAVEALSDMPPRAERELDAVTLHNQALMRMDEEPTDGFRKLTFLLSNPPYPPETFGNLLLLHCRHAHFDLAADILAENAHLTYRLISTELYEYLDAAIMATASPEEAYRKYDELAARHVEGLRRLTKKIQDARLARDNDAIKGALRAYDDALERYVPVLMALARVYWERDNYPAVEKIFRQSGEFCAEHDVWKLNVAHVFFMQENKFKDAIRYYEPIVKKHQEDILSVPAIVLANLCVSHIMTSQNEEAEELMRRIEKEEERAAYTDPDRQTLHLCIVNLVIGTLYCAKGNFEFGISRVIKSLEPYDKKLSMDTWYYAKRCFLALAEQMSKHMLMLKDASLQEIIAFLDAADLHGKAIKTSASAVSPAADVDGGGGGGARPARTVSFEARQLKRIYLRLA
ncbi:flagellar associated protein [Tribonema minus]|uniref:Flagellar associated protein n=1 Tax=Tribonema minus TaxID=303371 RepID=A0A836CMR6_9STRA|nr:flagellar associated protein [Tribonema minus]